jgi:hypothetical protein
MKKVATVLAAVLGVYLIGRAIVEPFVVNLSDPSTYRLDWGGPSLAGVLIVHCGPGVLSALGFAWYAGRRLQRRESTRSATSSAHP